MRVAGRVVTVHAGRARVECAPRPSGCGGCDAVRGCSWRHPRVRVLDVPEQADGQPLQPGDTVDLAIDDGGLLRAAMRIYLPPVAGLLLGAGLWPLSGSDGEAGSVLAALVGFIVGHLAARRLARSAGAAIGVQRACGVS